jgi:phage terminase large subunit-like protein
MAHNQYTTSEYKANRKQLLTGNPTCHWCGGTATTADHLIEVDRGGTNQLDNLVPACNPCNSRRGQAYRAQRDAQRKARREQATNDKTPFFTETHITPHPISSVFGGNQPELAGTDLIVSDESLVASEFPRLVTPNVGDVSYGPAVAAWAQRHLNIELMPWQVTALSGQLVHDDNGDLVFRESLCSTARQQGKSVALRALIGWWITEYAVLYRKSPQNVLSTANMLDRAEAIYLELAYILKESFGAKLIQQIGRKSVQMPDGSRWEVRAASSKLHGGSYDLIVVDELWNIAPEILDDALKPSQIARANPLLSMWSTAGDESSTAMINYRSIALQEIDEGVTSERFFAEWSIPAGCDPRDPQYWGLSNPALGRTITVKALQAAVKSDSFPRSHGNQWSASRGAWLDAGVWDKCRTTQDFPEGGILAVDSSVDEARYIGVRSVVHNQQVFTKIEFVVDTEAEMWTHVERVMTHPSVLLLVTPTLEIHVPTALKRRYQLTGYAELIRYTSLVRNMILEGKVLHDGNQTLAEHVNRATGVRTAQGYVLSSQKSPGPIEAARCMVWAVSAVSRPQNRQKPMLVVM